MIRKILNCIGYVLVAVFVIALVYVFAARVTGKTPKVFGYGILRVQTGSMEPHIEIGDVILIKETEPSKLSKGDVISYHGTQGELAGKLITHQIISEPYEEDGRYFFTTQGTAHGTIPDPEIDDTQISGKVLCVIPLLGSLFDFFTHWYGYLAFILLLLVAFGSELINLIFIIKRNKEDKEDDKIDNVKEEAKLDDEFHEKRNLEAEEFLLDLDKGN